MALHEVQLKGYSVRPGNLSLGTFDSYGIEQLHVTLDDTWSGLAVTATFNPPEGEPVEIRVPENGLIDVPAEATDNEGTGTIVYCGVANGAQRISKTQGYSVITHANTGTTVPFNPSESLATQVLQAALSAEQSSAEAKSVADGLRSDAANGKFNGKDGAKGDKGDTGTTPQLKIGEDNLWHVSYDNGATWVSLGVKATGDTGAAGKDGVDGLTPHIGGNGNWWIGDTNTGVLAKGKKGDTGAKGVDGVSPTAAVTQTNDGAKFTVTDASGTTTAVVKNGVDGKNGAPGANGVSPTVQVETIDGGHRVTLTDASGAHAVDVLDGKPGKDAVVDATLTQDGQAADAKVTGDAIGQLKEDLGNVRNKFEFDIEMNMHGVLNANPSDSTYINYADDKISRTSDYVNCQGYKHIYAKCNGSEWSWVIAFYDENKIFLPKDSIVGILKKEIYDVEIPNNAKYVRISTYNNAISYFAKIMFSKKNIDADISDLQARVTTLESPDDIYDGCEFALFKKWGLIGDSLSVGHTVSKDGKTTLGRNIYYSWGQYLARRIGNICLNFGRSGVTSKLWMDESETYCYPRLINPDNLCQAYIIALGANDSEMTLGSIADVNFTDMSQNADTEYGCYAKVINAVRNVSANVPIFLFTLPYPRNSDAKIKAINEMIRTFANDKEHFGKIFLVDLDADYNKYFETGKLEAQIGNTGWHLTSLGYLYASKVNEIALSKVIAENYNEFQDVFLLPCGKTEVLD